MRGLSHTKPARCMWCRVCMCVRRLLLCLCLSVSEYSKYARSKYSCFNSLLKRHARVLFVGSCSKRARHSASLLDTFLFLGSKALSVSLLLLGLSRRDCECFAKITCQDDLATITCTTCTYHNYAIFIGWFHQVLSSSCPRPLDLERLVPSAS
jgi:hypothetical protein